MNQSSEELLWQIIKDNMGDKSLDLFLNFYKSESLKEQYEGARQVFVHIFGDEQTNKFLQPISDLLKKEDQKS